MPSLLFHSDLPLDAVLDLIDDVQARTRALQGLQAAEERLAVGLSLARSSYGARTPELARVTGLTRREIGRLLRAAHMSAR